MATETIENVAHDDTPNRDPRAARPQYSAGFITEIESDSLPPGWTGTPSVPCRPEGRAEVDDAVAPGRLPPLPDHADAGLGWLEIAPIDLQALATTPRRRARSTPRWMTCLRASGHLRQAAAARACQAGRRGGGRGVRLGVGRYHLPQELAEKGIIFCSMSEAIKEHPSWSASTWAPWCRSATTTSPRSTRRCSPMAASCSSPGRALPDGAEHLLPHQRRPHRPVRAHPDRV